MTDVEQLLENADRALYQSKAAGRNCVSIWTPEIATPEPPHDLVRAAGAVRTTESA